MARPTPSRNASAAAPNRPLVKPGKISGSVTVMKVLSGAYIPDEGEIFIEGQKAHLTNPMDARRRGIDRLLPATGMRTKRRGANPRPPP